MMTWALLGLVCFAAALDFGPGCLESDNSTCLRCDEAYRLVDGFCLSFEHTLDPNDTYICQKDICIFTFGTTSTHIRVSSNVTTIVLPDNAAVDCDRVQINNVYAGDSVEMSGSPWILSFVQPKTDVVFLDDVRVDTLWVRNLTLVGRLTSKEVHAQTILLTFADLNTQTIERLVVDTPLTFVVSVSDSERKQIERKGLFLLDGTRIVGDAEVTLVLRASSGLVETGYLFQTDVCSNRTSVFVSTAREDWTRVCPDYIFVEPTTPFWWLGFACCLTALFVAFVAVVTFTLVKRMLAKRNTPLNG